MAEAITKLKHQLNVYWCKSKQFKFENPFLSQFNRSIEIFTKQCIIQKYTSTLFVGENILKGKTRTMFPQ